MSGVIQIVSVGFIPLVVTIILVFGLVKRQDVYGQFTKGAAEGLKTAVEIAPFIIGIFIAMDLLKNSGALDFMQAILAPAFNLLHIPTELFPMIAMKPVSGSGSLAILEKLIQECGPDSYVARVGAVMLGSSETIFYTLAVYFGATAVKYGRHTLLAGLSAYASATIAALILCNYV